MREATISLILKTDKNPLQCGSYRPVSLLNTDVKIHAKLLALRPERPLSSIISSDQTGFMKNRQPFFNIRRLLNILYGPTPSVTPEILSSLDVEKAFGRVEWAYLFKKKHQMFGKFGKTSGYKISHSKSELMAIHNAAKIISYNSTPFKINKEKFRFLGIWITHSFRDLYKANFLPLISSLK